MSHPTQRQYGRMMAARQRLLDVRAQRMDQLQRLRGFLRAQLAEFVSNVDPVTGQRFAEISADGNKARGEMSITTAFFEGTRFTVALDTLARFTYHSTPDGLLGDVARVVDVRVTADTTRAQLIVEDADGGVRHVDVADIVDELIDRAVLSVEADIAEAPPETNAAPRVNETIRPRAAALNFSLH